MQNTPCFPITTPCLVSSIPSSINVPTVDFISCKELEGEGGLAVRPTITVWQHLGASLHCKALELKQHLHGLPLGLRQRTLLCLPLEPDR